MKYKFYNFKLRQDLDKIKIFHWAQLFFILLALFAGLEFKGFHWPFLVQLIVFPGIYYIYFTTTRKLLYTHWAFTFFISLFLISGLFEAVFIYKGQSIFLCYLAASIFLGLQSYTLSSPIYYPRVNWWEYDFRYRDDVKVIVNLKDNDEEIQGRMTDLRRGAGCIVMFKKLREGEVIIVKVRDTFKELIFEAKIVSSREYSIGRGITYGVKFDLSEPEKRKDYKYFRQYWRDERKTKIKTKLKLNGKTS